MTPLNIVFAGTPAFALPCLDAIQASQHRLLALYTQPDRQAGRGRHMQASPVKAWGMDHAYPIYQPLHFKDLDAIETLRALQPDVLIVIAYGLILPPAVLAIPRLGCINVHASLLPLLRGAAPIQYAILSGFHETGITFMQMNAGMDTGPILEMHRCVITPTDTSATLHDKLAHLAAVPLIQLLDQLAKGTAPTARPQPDALATYAPKINKTDACIDWTQPALHLAQRIRAFNPWPIAYTHAPIGLLRIHEATAHPYLHTTSPPGTITHIDKTGLWVSTGEGCLSLQHFQFPGTKILSITDWLNGHRSTLAVGHLLK